MEILQVYVHVPRMVQRTKLVQGRTGPKQTAAVTGTRVLLPLEPFTQTGRLSGNRGGSERRQSGKRQSEGPVLSRRRQSRMHSGAPCAAVFVGKVGEKTAAVTSLLPSAVVGSE